jgi:hypothetical protein
MYGAIAGARAENGGLAIRSRRRDRDEVESCPLPEEQRSFVGPVWLWLRGRFRSFSSGLSFLGCLAIFCGLLLKLFTIQYAHTHLSLVEPSLSGTGGEGSVALREHLPDIAFVGSATLRTPLVSQMVEQCLFTRESAELIADSEGAVCTRELLNTSQCCDMSATPYAMLVHQMKLIVPSKHTCEGCLAQSMCCSLFEVCVSCCLSPSHLPLISVMRNETTHFAYRSLRTSFEFCTYRCRTSSASVQHENTYRGVHKYCYGMFAAPLEYPSTVNSDRSLLRGSKNSTDSINIDLYFANASTGSKHTSANARP